MRSVVIDTETTGLLPEEGHRVIEIGGVELVHRRPTGKTFHYYLQPDREIESKATEIHGITNAFLEGKPRFKDIVEEFKAFICGAELIIHNAPFDVKFIENEFALLQDKAWETLEKHCSITDTLVMARQKHPGQRNNLDALCKRYNVDNIHREKHGALLDAKILAEVYLRMTGGQNALLLHETIKGSLENNLLENPLPTASLKETLVIQTSEEELKAHTELLIEMEKKYGVESLWKSIDSD